MQYNKLPPAMFRLGLVILVLTLMSSSLIAQRRMLFNGYLKDSLTGAVITNGNITNVDNHRSVQTNTNGYFKLEAAPNDFIFATAPGYRYDTLNFSILFIDTIVVYLTPSPNLLPNVTVTSKYNRYQLDSIQRRTAFEQDRGTVYNAIDENHGPGFGVTVNLDRFFKKKYRNKKSEEKVFNRLEKDAYVRYRFSPEIVSLYTGLKGDPLQTFILKNSPTHDWLRLHPTNEDVLYYINSILKKNRKAP